MIRALGIGAVGLLLLCCAAAQQPVANTSTASMVTATGPEVLNFDELSTQALALLAQARAGSGSAGITLAKYSTSYTMLTARTRSGGAEIHQRWDDFLVVLGGSGVELTGGTVVLPKEQPGGEIRGMRLDGATPHALKKGDVIHIPAGTPHQSIEEPGQTITIFVIKVAAAASPASQGVTP